MKRSLTLTGDTHDAVGWPPHQVAVGQQFLFVLDPAGLGGGGGTSRGRRLLLTEASPPKAVLPLMDGEIPLGPGALKVSITAPRPAACVLSDRDLYRAEEDTAHVVVILPGGAAQATLTLHRGGALVATRVVSLPRGGIAVERFPLLPAGDYDATLSVGGVTLCRSCRFTVADYSLAPLSARPAEITMGEDGRTLRFALDVESFQEALEERVRVELMEGDRVVDEIVLDPSSPGRFEGTLDVEAHGSLRMRVAVEGDGRRVAEAALPGSRQVDRVPTVLSELGAEISFSLLPSPGALPALGGWLSRGEALDTPITAEEILTDLGRLRFRDAAEDAALVLWDGLTDRLTARRLGRVEAGATVEVPGIGPLTLVFVGAIIGGRPFEGFTTFLRPGALGLTVDAPATARPGETLALTLRLASQEPTQILLSVRDRRLTASTPPDVGLAASLKAGVEALTGPLGDRYTLGSLAALNRAAPGARRRQELGYAAVRLPTYRRPRGEGGERAREEDPLLAFASRRYGVPSVDLDEYDIDPDIARLVPWEVMNKHRITPVARAGNTLILAMVDPTNIFAIDDVTFLTGYRVEVVVTGEGQMQRALLQLAPDEGLFSEASGEIDWGLLEVDQECDEAEGDEGGEGSSGVGAARASSPELLFFDLLTVEGEATVTLPLAGSLGAFVIEAFACARGEWQRVERPLLVTQPLRVDLDLPPCLHPEDRWEGILRAASGHGRVRVRLSHDGAPLALGPDGDPAPTLPSPVTLSFSAAPGRWIATVEDPATGEVDRREVYVELPGHLSFEQQALRFIQAGEVFDPSDSDVLEARLLPGLGESLARLGRAVYAFEHACCEQTAAKILAAAQTWILTEDDAPARAESLDAVIAGVERLKRLFRPGEGFLFYPDHAVDREWSTVATRHLLKLAPLTRLPGLPEDLARALQAARHLADAAADVHGLRLTPGGITCFDDALAACADPARHAEIAAWLDPQLATLAAPPPAGRVAHRQAMAAAAEALLRLGRLPEGLRLATRVFEGLREGRLYSTWDSVSALGLLAALHERRALLNSATVSIDGGPPVPVKQVAGALGSRPLRVVEGVVAVQLTRIAREAWASFCDRVPIEAMLQPDPSPRPGPPPEAPDGGRIRAGDRLLLGVSLPLGYVAGDLVFVDLPPSLAWVHGGARVKRFSVDLEGRRARLIPLLALDDLDRPQRLALCLRNMFIEERVGSPGLVRVGG